MCGIVGVWSQAGGAGTLGRLAARMAERLAHRGPDDQGTWVDERAGLALGHRRLSILDLSPAGHQPMVSPCGRFVLSYNGEIYNHLDLRAELEEDGGAFDWRGHSDTETLLASLRHWGVTQALGRLNGMFAFALWDRSQRTLWLARDRLGEKPLYYGRCGESFLFGSELKALTVHPHWHGDVDRDALTLFMRYGYIPAPFSIYRGIAKLPPAHVMTVGDESRFVGEPVCYWDVKDIAVGERAAEDADRFIDELDALLRDAVKRRMASDVPLGAFLSGGIDSSTVTAMMQVQSDRPVKTFSIGFAETDYNEAPFARAVAKHLGTDHTELEVTPTEATALIPRLPEIWDEPFSDSSQIPTHLVSRLARSRVKVSLSGDGGDELFCGYTRYTRGYHFWRGTSWLPGPMRRGLATAITATPVKAWDVLARLMPPKIRVPHLGDRVQKLATVIRDEDSDGYYRRLVSHWHAPTEVIRGGREPETLFTIRNALPRLADPRDRMMLLDTLTYLPDDILTKVDRATMAVGLEARVPLLDHRVVSFAWSAPLSLKVRGGTGKWLLRRVLERYVPAQLTERPKMGFGVPIDTWLQGPLHDWADALLDETRLRTDGYFDPEPIRQMWRSHVTGERRWHYHLWDVLMVQAWLDAVKEDRRLHASDPSLAP